MERTKYCLWWNTQWHSAIKSNMSKQYLMIISDKLSEIKIWNIYFSIHVIVLELITQMKWGMIFSLQKHSHQLWGTPSSHSVATGGNMRSVCQADYSTPPSSVQIKNERSYIYTSFICPHVVHRHNFTFLIKFRDQNT